MKLPVSLGLIPLCAALVVVAAAACGEDLNENPNKRGVDANGDAGRPVPGGDLEDEKFPAYLLEPYTGPPIDYYDNTAVNYTQLRGRIARVFGDNEIGGNTDTWLASKIDLLGGADFQTRFAEARVITPDFLLALDGVAKDACTRAAANKTGPFGGTNPETDDPNQLLGVLYNKMLLRPASPQEITDTRALFDELGGLTTGKTDTWGGICEALFRHPDSIFTLPPSVSTTTDPAVKERLQIVKLANDFVGRPPNDAEFTQLAGKSINEKVDFFIATPEFKDFYLHRTRLRMESNGSPESDEGAYLWTYLAINGQPFQDLLAAGYSVDGNLNRIDRGAEHGKTGVLTMPGFIKSKPGLPHYNYAARVMTDFMGQLFEVPPEIVAMRVNATPTSTVDPTSKCIACHGVLTPLATQRLKWKDDGTYRETDENGAAIDDSDRGMVADYPYKGKGIEAFTTQAIKKERFLRQTFQSQFQFFLGRQMRWDLDERTVYLTLWFTAFDHNGDFRELMKVLANVPSYLGQ